jgi:hypothetical protein
MVSRYWGKAGSIDSAAGATMNTNDKIIHFHLEARRGNVRIATTQAVSVERLCTCRDRGFFGLYEATVKAMELELGPYVEKLVRDVSELEQ